MISKSAKMDHSSKDNPCPVCDRTHDRDCSWTSDKDLVLCYSEGKDGRPAPTANGYHFNGKYSDSYHGALTCAQYTKKKPRNRRNSSRPAKRFKPEKEKTKDLNSAVIQIECKVSELILDIEAARETPASARVHLAEWCKQEGRDKFTANGLLTDRLKEFRRLGGQNAVNADHKVVRDDLLIREALGSRLRYNQLLLQPELDGELFKPEEARISLIKDHDLPLKCSKPDIAELTYRLAKENAYHPISEYLNEVHQRYKDDTSILDGLAERYLGADKPIHQTMLYRFLIAAVARALDPGCKQDCALIIQGDQGCGKSTFFKVLASKPWFDDSYGATNDKDERLKLHYSWFVEWAELEVVFDRKSVSHVKAFLSCATDKVRPPYGLSQETLNRPSVIVGTTNEDQFLADSTGNRRYWVVPMRKKLDVEQLTAERDHIWAAAVSLYKSGKQWWLTDDEVDAADLDRKQYEEVHPWTHSIADYLFTLETVSTRELLCNALNIPIPKHNTPMNKRVANIMKSLGWTQTNNPVSYNQRKTRVWLKRYSENI